MPSLGCPTKFKKYVNLQTPDQIPVCVEIGRGI